MLTLGRGRGISLTALTALFLLCAPRLRDTACAARQLWRGRVLVRADERRGDAPEPFEPGV